MAGYGPAGLWSQGDVQRIQQQQQLDAEKQNRVRDRQLLPGFDKQYGRYGSLERGYENRGPQYSDFRNQQNMLGQQLAREAQGQGIGQQLVGMQARQAADRGISQQYGMAAGARPGQGALAMRQAAMNSGNIASQVGGQAAMAGGQVALNAQGQYGQFLQGARGQDEETRLRQLGLNDQAQLEALRQRLQAAGMQQQGNQFDQQLRVQRGIANMGQPSTGDKWLGAALGGGQVAAMFGGGK